MGRPKGSKNKPKNPSQTFLDLAQSLVTYCVVNNNSGDVALELKLPRNVLDQVFSTIKPEAQQSDNGETVSKFYFNGGTVELKQTETVTGA